MAYSGEPVDQRGSIAQFIDSLNIKARLDKKALSGLISKHYNLESVAAIYQELDAILRNDFAEKYYRQHHINGYSKAEQALTQRISEILLQNPEAFKYVFRTGQLKSLYFVSGDSQSLRIQTHEDNHKELHQVATDIAFIDGQTAKLVKSEAAEDNLKGFIETQRGAFATIPFGIGALADRIFY